MTEFRTEHDSMGEVQVPADALWGAQTQRAIGNFQPISSQPVPFIVIRELARIKGAAARVNAEFGIIEPDMAAAIEAAAREISFGAEADGGHQDQFPVPAFQTGSGTSTNMNVNEVIATLASQRLGRPVHPTITSTRPSRPTMCSRPQSTWPSPAGWACPCQGRYGNSPRRWTPRRPSSRMWSRAAART